MADEELSSLLHLPNPCLLAVLQCLADDTASLCSAARTHSRLHAAAVEAMSRINSTLIESQQGMDTISMQYVQQHGRHVDTLDLRARDNVTLRELPPEAQLTSLQCLGGNVQLLPGDNCQGGMVAAGVSLKQLELGNDGLNFCNLLDGVEQLEAALPQLPGLEQLVVRNLRSYYSYFGFPTEVLLQLTQLTHLVVVTPCRYSQTEAETALQPLQAVTRLAHLRIGMHDNRCSLTPDILYGMNDLTQLVIDCTLEPTALSGKTRLQHLELQSKSDTLVSGGGAGAAQLLLELQHMHQLTHLDLSNSLQSVQDGVHSPAAFSALTASSKLQQLNISACTLPAGALQHVFPTSRQLSHLRELCIGGPKPQPQLAVHLDCSRLVSCCPGLLCLDMLGLSRSVNSWFRSHLPR